MPPSLSLLAYGPAWGMPSLDAESCKAHAWMLFCGLRPHVDFVVEACNNPHVGLSGELPVLQVKSGDSISLAEPHEIFAQLALLGHDPDARLTAAQRAESIAYTALIEERLAVALLFSWWEEEANYEAAVRPTLAATLPMPLCYYLPWTLRRRAHSQLARRRCCNPTIAYAHGEAALEALATRLDGRQYFHGSSPSGVDASAFAYLTAVLRCPLPEDRLRRKLQTYPSLVDYCERISAEHFGGSAPLLEALASPAASAKRLAALKAAAAGGSAAAQAAADAAEEEAEEETARAAGAAASSTSTGVKKEPRTKKQEDFRRRSRTAVAAAAGSAMLYALAVGALGREEEADEESN